MSTKDDDGCGCATGVGPTCAECGIDCLRCNEPVPFADVAEHEHDCTSARPLGSCTCDCHHTDGKHTLAPCCQQCPHCKRLIASWYPPDAHIGRCSKNPDRTA